MLTFLHLLWLSTASAQDAPEPAAPAEPVEPVEHDLLVGATGVAEVWSDAALATVYRTRAISGSVSATWQLHRFIEADVEVMYLRVFGESDQRFEMTPIALDAAAYKTFGSVELFGGLGPAIVPFTDQGVGTRTGTKLGLDTRVGMRIRTDLYDPPDYPPSPIERVEVEIFAGRRTHFGPTTSAITPGSLPEPAGRIDLSAVRVGVGVRMRL